MITMSNRLAVGFVLGVVSSIVLGLMPWISKVRAQSTNGYAYFYSNRGTNDLEPLTKG